MRKMTQGGEHALSASGPCRPGGLTLALTFAILVAAGAASCRAAASKERLFPVLQDGKYGFMNAAGRVVIAPRYDQVSDFAEGRRPSNGAGSGATSGRPDTAVPFQFEWAAPFSEGLAIVQKGDVHGFIDARGRIVISPASSRAEVSITDGPGSK